jgi:TIR domain-containing protein
VGAAYQLHVLTAAQTDFTRAIVSSIRTVAARFLSDLGLGSEDLAIIENGGVDALDPALPAVLVYVSDTAGAVATPTLLRALSLSLLILPVVPSLRQFSSWVPAELRPINGLAPSQPGDCHGAAVIVTTRVFEELRLLRRARRAFISYRRAESTAVAEQLHDALERRRYEVFLDTFSVNYGLDFQSVLWDTLARTDLVVLLNTRTAFDSQWVEQEICRANVCGLGVLQLLWPELTAASRPKGTEFAEAVYLKDGDFDAPYSTSSQLRLSAATCDDVLARAELLRARAHATRRRRVISELADAARRHGLDVVLEQTGVAQIVAAKPGPAGARAPGPTTGQAKGHPCEALLPIVGPPDAEILHDHWLESEKAKRSGVLVYDALGVVSLRAAHLLWLDQHLPQKAVAIQEIDAWMKRKVV